MCVALLNTVWSALIINPILKGIQMKDSFHFLDFGPDCPECHSQMLWNDLSEHTWTPDEFEELQRLEKRFCLFLLVVMIVGLVIVGAVAFTVANFDEKTPPPSIQNVIDEEENSSPTIPNEKS